MLQDGSHLQDEILMPEVEDDGLQRLCGHGSTLSSFATIHSLESISRKAVKFDPHFCSWMRRHGKALPFLTLGRRTDVLHQLRVRPPSCESVWWITDTWR